MNAENTDRQNLRVRDIMSSHPTCVGGASTLHEVAELLDENEISGAPVIDHQNRVIGVVSKTDLVHRILEGPPGSTPGSLSAFLGMAAQTGSPLDPENLGVVEDFMTTDPVTATESEGVAEVARRMAEERVHRVVVVDDARRAIGMVTTLDVLACFPQ